MKDLNKVVTAVAICLAVGFAGALLTADQIVTWYGMLNKPVFTPPNWVFGPVWTLLYILMGVAAGLVWGTLKKHKEAKHALFIFGIQLALNFGWSILFFGLQSPLLGLVDILVLWAMIIVTIAIFWQYSRTSSILLIPYLAWVTYATVLNIAIVKLN